MAYPRKAADANGGTVRGANPILLAGALIVAAVAVSYLGYTVYHELGLASMGGPDGPTAAAMAPTREPLKQFNTTDLRIDREQIRSGGPPKDGIPALTVGDPGEPPKLAPVEDADFLDADDRVVGVKVGDEARAYAIGVLNWHECVNDTLGGRPIAVVYCPLCDSVTVVDRRIGDRTLGFGISGLLTNSNVLLYDRQTDSLWSQVKLEAISGPYAGQSLDHLGGWRITTFAAWKKRHPGSTVLTFDTGHRRRYQRNPYGDYFDRPRLMFPVAHEDDRLARKARVIGIRLADRAIAYPLAAIADAEGGRVTDRIDGALIVLEADDEANVHLAQAPDEAEIVHTFWFTWAAFHPQTEIRGRDSEPAG